jgi:hypothetical protein
VRQELPLRPQNRTYRCTVLTDALGQQRKSAPTDEPHLRRSRRL